MKYKAYPEYEDSGVEWLGETPAPWQVVSAKRIFGNRRTTADELDEQLAASQKYGVIPQKLMIDRTGNKVALALKGTQSFKKVCQNDFVISLRSFEGGIEYSAYNGCVSPAYTVLYPIKNINSGYYKFLNKSSSFVSALQATTDSLRDGKAISYEQFCYIKVPFPSFMEQEHIANFLDHETAKIDQLIAKQETLVELLKEKRQAVISHAVTKGLNPDVKMKDSGVEWFGEVPEHWGVMQLRRYVKHIEQGKSPECEARLADDNEWAVLKSGCVNGGVFRQNEHKALPFNIKPYAEYEVKVGDLLMSRASGSIELIGSVAFVESCREKLLLSDKVFRVLLNKSVLPEYFSIMMKSDSIRNQIKLAINGAEGLANNITKEAIKSFFTTFPPISEQVEILRFIKQRMSILEKADTKLIHSLHLLKERRSALISTAVTGKIDVRDWKSKDRA